MIEGKGERQGKREVDGARLGGGEQGSEEEEGGDLGTEGEGAGDWVRQGYRGAASASFRANLRIPSSPSSDESISLSFTSTATSTSSPSSPSTSTASSPPAPLHMKGCDPRIFDTPVAVMNLPVCACEYVTFDHQRALSEALLTCKPDHRPIVSGAHTAGLYSPIWVSQTYPSRRRWHGVATTRRKPGSWAAPWGVTCFNG